MVDLAAQVVQVVLAAQVVPAARVVLSAPVVPGAPGDQAIRGQSFRAVAGQAFRLALVLDAALGVKTLSISFQLSAISQ